MDFLSSKIPGSRFVARPMNLGEFQLALGRKELDFCLLYTSDAADERSSVDLGGRRIIKKKQNQSMYLHRY